MTLEQRKEFAETNDSAPYLRFWQEFQRLIICQFIDEKITSIECENRAQVFALGNEHQRRVGQLWRLVRVASEERIHPIRRVRAERIAIQEPVRNQPDKFRDAAIGMSKEPRSFSDNGPCG